MRKDPALFRRVEIADGVSTDAFGKLRVSEMYGVFEHKNLGSKNQGIWNEATNGAGASITFNEASSDVTLTVGTASGEYAIRQSKQYSNYIPGKSQLIVQTGALGAGKANVVKRIGYYDDDNGLFFELNGTTLYTVIRSDVSGSVVDTKVAQSSWNLDKLDGTGQGGIILDVTKVQIFVIDFQWLGVGRVRFGFVTSGRMIYVHEVVHANVDTTVYMRTPNLPIRYEIRNTGIAASATTMTEICSSVANEGGFAPKVASCVVGNGVTTIACTTRRPVLAIRLKSTFGTKDNRRTVLFQALDCYAETNPAFIEVAHVSSYDSTTGGSWASVGTESGVEYNVGITAVTNAVADIIEHVYLPASTGKANYGSATTTDTSNNRHKIITNNFDCSQSEMFVVYVTSFSGTTNVSSSIKFEELF
jgi:hypothetical protein